MKKSIFLIVASLALAPISFGNKAIAQTFEKLFEGDSYVPYLYADINDDGKQEYVLYGKWRTLAGKELYSFPEGSAIWPSAMLYLTANPVPGFFITANDYEENRGDVIFIKDGKYVISNVYSKAYNGESSLFGATWADINLDGRMDMLYWKKERFGNTTIYYPYVKMMCADGTFVEKPLELVTDMDELQGAMDATGGNGTFSVSNNASFSGFSSGKGASLPVGNINVVDLNQDGYPDFIDEKASHICRWATVATIWHR